MKLYRENIEKSKFLRKKTNSLRQEKHGKIRGTRKSAIVKVTLRLTMQRQINSRIQSRVSLTASKNGNVSKQSLNDDKEQRKGLPGFPEEFTAPINTSVHIIAAFADTTVACVGNLQHRRNCLRTFRVAFGISSTKGR